MVLKGAAILARIFNWMGILTGHCHTPFSLLLKVLCAWVLLRALLPTQAFAQDEEPHAHQGTGKACAPAV